MISLRPASIEISLIREANKQIGLAGDPEQPNYTVKPVFLPLGLRVHPSIPSAAARESPRCVYPSKVDAQGGFDRDSNGMPTPG